MIPSLHADRLDAAGDALAEHGGFFLEGGVDSALLAEALAAARALFALPTSAKEAAGIEASQHFHGWSQMQNQRDWREQLHLGRELLPRTAAPPYRSLEGPNLWPIGADELARVLLGYLDAVAAAGDSVLQALVGGAARDGYAVMKLIGYHPQAGSAVRSGVAAHVDFSWLTLTLADAPGLEVRGAGGWTAVEPRPGAIWVHAGEILELATGGRHRATPHRVTNGSFERTRVSIPFFLNPPLDETIAAGRAEDAAPSSPGEHVHRVLPPGAFPQSLHFGEAEWQRKGRNGWCHLCAAPTPS